QIVTYEGGTYIVTTAPPTGTPDSSPDYAQLAAAGATGETGATGATGATGVGLSGLVAFDPVAAPGYEVGQIVTYEGGTYIVTTAPPTGTPDSSPDYAQLAAAGATGETGATGATGAGLSGLVAFDPIAAPGYEAGQVVTYEGGTYMVTTAPPTGTPDSSADYMQMAAAGATGVTGATGATGPNIAEEGFAAFLPTLAVSGATQLNNWTVSSPYFSSGSFNPVTGQYTVPATGVYSISATINYSTTVALSVGIGASVNPAFVVRRIAPSTTDLITGLFPILNVAALVLNLRAILGSGTVTLSGEVLLNAGDAIALVYEPSGLTLSLNLGSSTSSGVLWSVYRLT
ncbi:MAG: hypothetical protein E6X17_18155, partial [Sporomusaceae bacterium]|nr:hypothetical protein [Sporomusaceae bacterium]